MADDVPPVETEPFDPLFHTAIRLRCPAFNQLNTFIIVPGLVHCNKSVAYPSFTNFTKNNNRCNKVYPLANAQIVKRTCNKIKTSDVVTIETTIRINSSYSCKLPASSAAALVKRSARCAINSADVVKKVSFENCRLSGKLTVPMAPLTKRVCRRKHSAPDLVEMKRARHLCGTFPIAQLDARYACKNKVLTTIQPVVIRLISNLARCKAPDVLDPEMFLSKRVCRNLHLVDDTVVVLVKATAPRLGSWTCKLYPAFAQDTNGRKLCNTIKTLIVTGFRYKGSQGQFSCKTYPVTTINGRRWRCGTVLLTIVDARTFGRIWGGRPNTNYFVRESGRMIGKFR